jgi:alpha-galactosidase
MGLKFGMYNDIGTNLCAGAAVGTCGHEKEYAQTYIEWDIDCIKVDNCYYLWDNATFSNSENAKYTYAPAIKSICIKGCGLELSYDAVSDGELFGNGAFTAEEDGVDFVKGIGTYDGTGPDNTPVGFLSSELRFNISSYEAGEADLTVMYAAGREPDVGCWLQVAMGEGENAEYYYDDLLPETENKTTFIQSPVIKIKLKKGENVLRLMNHRRQENTLSSYAELVKGFEEAFKKGSPRKDILLSICEWGKTQPQNWGYKVGDSWRILNDITFQVGSDGDPGHANWSGDYTTGVTNQYNKAVIMDEYAGLTKGWNDPDMMMIGMTGLDETMCRSHMAMWCMLNSPLMLGLDLRRVEKGDPIYKIISNKDLIDLNQDPLGVQAKRIYSTLEGDNPDKVYLRDNKRIDVLAKPLSDKSVAIAFINLDTEDSHEKICIDKNLIIKFLRGKMTDPDVFENASSYSVKDLWSGDEYANECGQFEVAELKACDSVVWRIIPQ